MNGLIFVVLFVILFLLSRLLTTQLSLFFLRATHSYHLAIQMLALLLLPGVIFHEIGHWLVAGILFVPTGEIEFLPQVQGNSVKLGSVQVGKTDIMRRFAIGVAPVLFGLFVLLSVFWYLSPTFFPVTWKTVLFFYIVFEIGNTMFSSAKDLEGAVVFLFLCALVLTLFFFLKIPVFAFLLSLSQNMPLQNLFYILSIFFLIAIAADLFILVLLFSLTKIFRK